MSFVAVAVGVAGIAVSVYQYADASKKQTTLSNQGLAISSLSYADQRALNEKILRANTQNERLAIMANAVAGINSSQAIQDSKNTQTTSILVIVAALSLITAAYLSKKT